MNINVFLCKFLMTVCLGMASLVCAEPLELQSQFNIRYERWMSYLYEEAKTSNATNPIDSTAFFYDNKAFDDLVCLGPESLPFVVNAMQTNSLLCEAFQRISKWSYHLVRTGHDGRSFEWFVEGHPETKTTARKSHAPPRPWMVYALWWTDWRFQTKSLFNTLHLERQNAIMKGDYLTATNNLVRIQELGIPVLPLLVEHYSEAPEYLSIIENLSSQHFPQKVSPNQLGDWWKQNEKLFFLPSKEETDRIEIPPFE